MMLLLLLLLLLLAEVVELVHQHSPTLRLKVSTLRVLKLLMLRRPLLAVMAQHLVLDTAALELALRVPRLDLRLTRYTAAVVVAVSAAAQTMLLLVPMVL
jgi:hypothetical protein